jgi:hypothetical protein
VFRLGRRRPDGTTERDHLVAYQRATGKTPDELHVPPVPAGTQALWAAFCDLNAARLPSSNGAVSAIALSEIAAWQQLHGVELVSWEVDSILAIDQAALAALSEKAPA